MLGENVQAILLRFLCVACIVLLWSGQLHAQFAALPGTHHPFDAIPPADSNTIVIRTIEHLFIPKIHQDYPLPAFYFRQGEDFSPVSMDEYFYVLVCIYLLAGVMVRLFPKYFHDLFTLFYTSGFRQKSIRDQLAQNTAASLGLNLLFFLSAGVFVFLMVHQSVKFSGRHWYIDAAVCIVFLMIVYGVKYFSVLLAGWIFAAKELSRNYAFLIFFVNKIAGLVLLPIIVILWMGNPILKPVFQTLSLLAIGFLFLYRYFLVLPLIRSKSGLSAYHFFLYLCTFEIMPILLLVRFLGIFLSSSN